MQIKQIAIKNIGLIADTVIPVDKSLILFYGEVLQGKSTILNAVRWCFGGKFPEDLIRHGSEQASVEITLDNGSIKRSWYRGKNGTEARPVTFIRDGKSVPKPAQEIEKFLNPFLLNQDHLRNMTEQGRTAYFRELFAVDTAELDTEATTLHEQAKDLRATIKGYGEIDLTPVQLVDVSALRSKLAAIRDESKAKESKWNSDCQTIRKAHEKDCDAIRSANSKAIERNLECKRGTERLVEIDGEIEKLKKAIEAYVAKRLEIEAWLKAHPLLQEIPLPAQPELPQQPATPDTSALEAEIQNGAAANVRHEQYKANLARAAKRDADKKRLAAIEAREDEIKAEKTAKLKGISATCGIPDLAFDEAGNFTFENVSGGMLSDSQIMRLSGLLSAKYPKGFGVDLLDRGESLGKSIFTLIDRAKREEKTILATVVGEAPAKTPPDVGVWVVDQGKVTPKEGQLNL